MKIWVDRQIVPDDCLIQSAEDFVNVCEKSPRLVKQKIQATTSCDFCIVVYKAPCNLVSFTLLQ